jgi:hypothetical protein
VCIGHTTLHPQHRNRHNWEDITNPMPPIVIDTLDKPDLLAYDHN